MVAELDETGYATLGQILDARQCANLIRGYARAGQFRARIEMTRYGFGRGEYQYYDYPLPDVIDGLRRALYERLAPVANRWAGELGWGVAYPACLEEFLARCHAAGQVRPTPLILRYGPGDYNCLHQDLYGELRFPLQVVVLLSDPETDFTGGELVLTEQRARRQTRVEVVPLQRGQGVVVPVHQRPVASARGTARANMRHGVSRLRSGQRYCLGIIFHDAR